VAQAARDAARAGRGSLTKFCHKKLRMKTTAIELNPQVIAACRLWFKLPRDDSRLSVVLGDAAEVVAHEHWRGQVDALQVDLYDHEAAAPVLDSEAFYRRLPPLLTEDGCMTVNLFGRSSSYERSLARIQAAFGREAVWAFRPTREGNTIVLALREPAAAGPGELSARAEAIASAGACRRASGCGCSSLWNDAAMSIDRATQAAATRPKISAHQGPVRLAAPGASGSARTASSPPRRRAAPSPAARRPRARSTRWCGWRRWP
jgi:hypothetical protein